MNRAGIIIDGITDDESDFETIHENTGPSKYTLAGRELM